MCSESEDLDFTSSSHIRKAIRRAESDYGFYISNENSIASIKNRTITRPSVSEQNHSKLVRIASHGYIDGVKSASCITNKEIVSSVRRSRRWSGRESNAYRQKYVVAPVNNLNLEPGVIPQSKDSSRLRSNEETAYHKTVCDILSDRGTKSSYGHVFKMLSRGPKASKFRLSNRRTNCADEENCNAYLPAVPTFVPRRTSRTESSRFLNTGRYDWAIRYSSESPSNEKETNQIIGHPSPRTFTRPFQSHHSKPVNLSQVCEVISDSLNQKEIKRSDKFCKKILKQQAMQGIETCYNKKQSDRIGQPKVVVVHLPNPNIPQDNLIEDAATLPRLSMRSGNKSASGSLLSDVEQMELDKEKNIKPTYFTNSMCKINSRPFLLKHQFSHTGKS